MLTVATLSQVPRDALLYVVREADILVYMPGDTLPVTPVVPEVAVVTAQQFRDRFSDAELAAMLSSADIGVKLLVLKIQTADPFPMNKPTVQQGLDYLVLKDILTAPRRAVVGALT